VVVVLDNASAVEDYQDLDAVAVLTSLPQV
jgi:hypothetical protein